jgi:hypothetical protein
MLKYQVLLLYDECMHPADVALLILLTVYSLLRS